MAPDDAILTALEDPEGLERALEHPAALIYRHAPGDWRGFMAIGQVRRFALDHPDLPVFVVRDRDDPSLSDVLTRRLGAAGDTPQAILVRKGEPVWRTSRGAVRYERLETAVRQH